MPNSAWPWWRAWRASTLIRLSAAWHALAAIVLLVWPETWPVLLAGIVLNHAGLTVLGCWPRSRALGPNLVRLPPANAARGEVALTFDDGPDREVTPRVLDLLEQAGATASFFCIGARAATCPDLVAEIRRRGHSVENHTQTHGNLFAFLGIRGLQREIGAAQAVLSRTGIAPRFFRAPMGLRSPLLDAALAGSGLAMTGWTRRGYDGVRRDPERVLARLARNLAAGDILLLHDGSCARTHTGEPVVLAVLPRLLDLMDRRGLRAVSLPRGVSAAADAQPAAAAE